ncbi:MAG: RlmE family RNA methyltransferase [Rhodospirillaceae bacterium]|jgi:23S rRNA (uridine2552-2'-O)-methyltransferase|nr:RlmE family RNA methyltransferase [Rhodospirillaceae bacterium]
MSGKPGNRSGSKSGGGSDSARVRSRGGRGAAVRVKRGKGRSISSRRWLERQLNDPYVVEARRQGLRSRAAFKLRELDERFGLLRSGQRVLDLGAAPGGWTQVAVAAVQPARGGGRVVAADINEMEGMEEAVVLCLDVFDEAAPRSLAEALGGPADLVLSDMAPAATGHAATDHLRIVGLAEAALDLALTMLAPGGTFIAKVWQGGTEGELLARLKRRFAKVRHFKPPSSRAESAETYVVATGFRPDTVEDEG